MYTVQCLQRQPALPGPLSDVHNQMVDEEGIREFIGAEKGLFHRLRSFRLLAACKIFNDCTEDEVPSTFSIETDRSNA